MHTQEPIEDGSKTHKNGPSKKKAEEEDCPQSVGTYPTESGVMQLVKNPDGSNIKVGDTIRPTHPGEDIVGDTEDPHHEPVTIVGILKHTGTPNDRAIFMNLEGFYEFGCHQEGPSTFRRFLQRKEDSTNNKPTDASQVDPPREAKGAGAVLLPGLEPGADEHGLVLRQRAGERGDGEHGEAGEEDAPRADEVAEPPGEQLRHQVEPGPYVDSFQNLLLFLRLQIEIGGNDIGKRAWGWRRLHGGQKLRRGLRQKLKGDMSSSGTRVMRPTAASARAA